MPPSTVQVLSLSVFLYRVFPVLLVMAGEAVPLALARASVSKGSSSTTPTHTPSTSTVPSTSPTSPEPHKMTVSTLSHGADLLTSGQEVTSWTMSNISEWLSPTDLLNTSTGITGDRQCVEWQDSQHALFQTANLCYFAAFLVPRHLRLCALMVRAILSGGFLMCTFWAGMYVCAPDILAWNVIYFVVNSVHVAYLSWKYFPPRIRPELRDLYAKVFVPLKMDKQNFRDLLRDAQVVDMQEGDHYAIEDISSADERLSILLKGRLKVTCEDTHLHNIFPNQFIDSPEWEACSTGSDDLYQVTIVAAEPSRYVCWSRRKLQQLLRSKPYLDAVIYNLVGKDITHKLYLLNEHLNPKFPNSRGGTSIQPGDICSDWHWKQQFQRSLSVDAVHTGTRGQVQSHIWMLQSRRTSAHSNSLGSGEDEERKVNRKSNLRVHFPPTRRKVNNAVFSLTSWIGNSVRKMTAGEQISERYPLWSRLRSCNSEPNQVQYFSHEDSS